VDGVLTDGRIFIRDNGEEIKSFHTLDGHGLKMLQASGVQTAIITGRDAPSVGIRVKQLGINYYFKGISDKRAAYEELRAQAGVEEAECAFVGDDVVDLPVMVRCGLPVAVPDAHWFTLQHAAYITKHAGGAGAGTGGDAGTAAGLVVRGARARPYVRMRRHPPKGWLRRGPRGRASFAPTLRTPSPCRRPRLD